MYRGSGTRPLAKVNRHPLGGARSDIVLMACMIKVVQRPLVCWERRLAAAVTFEPHFVKLHAPCVDSLSSVGLEFQSPGQHRWFRPLHPFILLCFAFCARSREALIPTETLRRRNRESPLDCIYAIWGGKQRPDLDLVLTTVRTVLNPESASS